MRPRKLLRFDILQVLHQKTEDGVPLTKALQQSQVYGMTRPTVRNLINCYKEILKLVQDGNKEEAAVILNSISPFWCNYKDVVQEPPANVYYRGKFPFGEWYEDN